MENYATSDDFTDLGKWGSSPSGKTLAIAGTNDPVYIIVIGVVSTSKLYVQPHGNFSNNYNMKVGNTKLQLTLCRPTGTVFENDFDKAMTNLQLAQENGKIGNEPQQYFIVVDDGGDKALRMSWPIFEWVSL